MSKDRYAEFERLKIDYPADRVLRLSMHNPANPMNSADARMHYELAYVWPVIDADPDVSAVILRGSDTTFSAGGDFDMIDEIVSDYGTRMQAWKEARDIVYNVINCSKPTIAPSGTFPVGQHAAWRRSSSLRIPA